VGPQHLGITDARQHQQLRRVDDPSRQDDFPIGQGCAGLVALQVLDPDRAVAFEQDLRRQRVCFDLEIWPGKRGTEISDSGAAAAPVASRIG